MKKAHLTKFRKKLAFTKDLTEIKIMAVHKMPVQIVWEEL
jgi:hypothetical protein